MINKLKNKEIYEKLSKREILDEINLYLNELERISRNGQLSKESFEKDSWPYYQAFECGVQNNINKLREYINI